MTTVLAPVRTLGEVGTTAVRAAYEDGFAAHLRASWDEVYTRRRMDEEALAVVVDHHPVGFVLLRALGRTDRIYLRYLVLGRDQRGKGLGTDAWDHLRAHCVREDYAVLVWDVEHPDEDGIDDAEVSVRRRRIAFYDRVGGVVVPATGYTNPHSVDGHLEETPMLLMATSLTGIDLPVQDTAWVDALVADVDQYRWERPVPRVNP